MPPRRVVLAGAILAVAVTIVTACGSSDDNRPPPTIGDPSVLERPVDTTAATAAP